jgi:hypothetical protein
VRSGVVIAPLLVASIAVAAPAAAGIDVLPDPARPRLILDGDRITPPSAQDPAPVPKSAAPVADPINLPPRSCKVDPEVGTYGCEDVEPAEPEEDGPEVTPGDVLRAVQEIGLPSLQVKIQPGEKTLVNVPTIFWAEPQPFERSVELLGFDVDVVAEPVGYHWVHGDGSVATTTQPGRPYPAMDVTHRYTAPADGVQTRVDVTYRVRFRVDGGAWSTIGQTLLAPGPVSALDVKEAVPVLTRP